MGDRQANAGNSALGNEKRPADIQGGGSDKPMNDLDSPLETSPETKRHSGGPDAKAKGDDAARFAGKKGGSVGEQGDAAAPSYDKDDDDIVGGARRSH